MVLAVVSLLGGEAALVGGFVEAGVAVAEVQTAADAGSDPSAIVIQSTSTVLRVFYEYFWSLTIAHGSRRAEFVGHSPSVKQEQLPCTTF